MSQLLYKTLVADNMGDLESGGMGKENHVTLAFASAKVSLQQEAPSCNKPAYASTNVSLQQQQETIQRLCNLLKTERILVFGVTVYIKKNYTEKKSFLFL